MRTTVVIPDSLAAEAREHAHAHNTSLSALMTDGLRMRLASASKTPNLTPLPVCDLDGHLQPWVDPASNVSLYDAADLPDDPS